LYPRICRQNAVGIGEAFAETVASAGFLKFWQLYGEGAVSPQKMTARKAGYLRCALLLSKS
jgi:hypothetical protein